MGEFTHPDACSIQVRSREGHRPSRKPPLHMGADGRPATCDQHAGWLRRTRGLYRDFSRHAVGAPTGRASALENPASKVVFAAESAGDARAPTLRHGGVIPTPVSRIVLYAEQVSTGLSGLSLGGDIECLAKQDEGEHKVQCLRMRVQPRACARGQRGRWMCICT